MASGVVEETKARLVIPTLQRAFCPHNTQVLRHFVCCLLPPSTIQNKKTEQSLQKLIKINGFKKKNAVTREPNYTGGQGKGVSKTWN